MCTIAPSFPKVLLIVVLAALWDNKKRKWSELDSNEKLGCEDPLLVPVFTEEAHWPLEIVMSARQ